DLKARISILAFSPDSRLLAALLTPTTAGVWDVASGQRLAVLAGHTGDIARVDFAADSKTLFSRGADGQVRAWDARAGLLRPLPLPQASAPARALAFTPDGKALLSGHASGAVKTWDVAKPAAPSVLNTGAESVTLLQASADGKVLLTRGPAGK